MLGRKQDKTNPAFYNTAQQTKFNCAVWPFCTNIFFKTEPINFASTACIEVSWRRIPKWHENIDIKLANLNSSEYYFVLTSTHFFFTLCPRQGKIKVTVQHLRASRICRLNGSQRHRQGRCAAKAAVQARAHRLWPADTQPYVAIVCRFNGLHSVVHANTWTTTSPTPGGKKGWVGLVGWPIACYKCVF